MCVCLAENVGKPLSCVDSADGAKDQQKRVLVHCMTGVTRSAFPFPPSFSNSRRCTSVKACLLLCCHMIGSTRFVYCLAVEASCQP